MRALVPWTRVGPLKNEMERLFDRFFEPDNGESFAMGEWAPRLDLSETKDALIVKVEVPAIDPKEILVSIMEGMLTVKGEKKGGQGREILSRRADLRLVLAGRPASGARGREQGQRDVQERASNRDAPEDHGSPEHGHPDQDWVDVIVRRASA
jgi:hypothetical protein